MLITNVTVHTMEGVTIPNGYVAVSGDKIANDYYRKRRKLYCSVKVRCLF